MNAHSKTCLLRAADVSTKVRWVKPALLTSSTSGTGGSVTHVVQANPPNSKELAEQVEEFKAKLQTEFETEVVRAKEAGYQEGLQRGQALAQNQAQREALDFKASRDKVIASISSAWQQRQQTLEQDAVSLAYASVCHILGTMAGHRELVHHIVQQAIRSHKLSGPLRVRLPPEDWRWMHNNDADEPPGTPGVSWELDPQLITGECMIEGSSGTLDTSLTTQLENLKALLLHVHNSRVSDQRPQGGEDA